VELVAILLTDLPLDERRFHGLLRDIAGGCLAGAISPRGLEARHSFGDAQRHEDVVDVHVLVKPAASAPAAALRELHTAGFRPQSALELLTFGDAEARENAWALVNLYAEELRGWVLTDHLSFELAAQLCGNDDGLLHVPSASHSDTKAVLISATTMKQLAP